jgi:pre-mRNA-processing factor SLU7
MASKMENNANEFGDSDDDDDDEEKYADKSDMPGQKVNAKTRTTIRNLRYRQDFFFFFFFFSVTYWSGECSNPY